MQCSGTDAVGRPLLRALIWFHLPDYLPYGGGYCDYTYGGVGLVAYSGGIGDVCMSGYNVARFTGGDCRAGEARCTCVGT